MVIQYHIYIYMKKIRSVKKPTIKNKITKNKTKLLILFFISYNNFLVINLH